MALPNGKWFCNFPKEIGTEIGKWTHAEQKKKKKNLMKTTTTTTAVIIIKSRKTNTKIYGNEWAIDCVCVRVCLPSWNEKVARESFHIMLFSAMFSLPLRCEIFWIGYNWTMASFLARRARAHVCVSVWEYTLLTHLVGWILPLICILLFV